MFTCIKKEIRSHSKNERLKSYYKNSYKEIIFYEIGSKKVFWDKVVYPEMRSGIHKSFSTLQEKSFYAIHSREYKRDYRLKLRQGRSCRSLPDSYDDLSSDVYGQKGWKRRSKRKHQYYR